MSANEKCPPHYSREGEQHWDRAWRLYGRGYFVGAATKYAERYHKKNGLDDLDKAIHFLEKLRELERAALDGSGPKGAEGAQPVVAEASAVPIPFEVNPQVPAPSDEELAKYKEELEHYTTHYRPVLMVPPRVFKGEGETHSSIGAPQEQWLARMKEAGVRVVTPHENPWGYLVREGVLWCPRCGCPHDSYDPFAPGLTCAQCKRPLTTFEETEKPCDGERDHESHHFEPLPDYQGAACKDCGALSGMPSGKLLCPGKKACAQCQGSGLVACEWSTDLTPCPMCSGGPV